jgi:mRNA interferase MazF
MIKPMRVYKAFDVVVVPFPFSDKALAKKRPALVLSSEPFNSGIRHSVMTMITSANHSPWPLDIAIQNLEDAGLTSSSLVRMKFFTLDHRLIQRHIGHLSVQDQDSVKSALQSLFPVNTKRAI